MALERRKKKEVVLSESEISVYVSKIDYLNYTDNKEEAKKLLVLEHEVIFCTGQIQEIRQKRWEALSQMKVILKKEKSFMEVMGIIGLSREMISDINTREKLYITYGVDKNKLLELKTREIRALSKEKNLNSLDVERVLSSKNVIEEIEIIKKERMQKLDDEIIEDIETVEDYKEKERKKILKNIEEQEKKIKECEDYIVQLKQQYKNLK